MRKSALALSVLAATVSYVTLACASPAGVLAANKAAMGGHAWDGKASVTLTYAYSGQGMTGTIKSVDDLGGGAWVDDVAIGPAKLANGFDGSHAWQKDQSGTVTQQDGGDARPLSVNEGYRRANMWWRPGFGGATVVDDGRKSEGGSTYDVLTVTPRDGKDFDAWFDAKSHLLWRIVEQQGMQHSVTTLTDYRAVDGAMFAYKTNISIGDAKYDQNATLTSVDFGGPRPAAAFAMPKVTVNDFSIANGVAQTSLPFDLINNHIYAHVAVNGKPFVFIFDTGGVNLVTPPTAQLLGLSAEGHMQGNGAGEGHIDIQLTRIQSLQVGDATIRDQVFPVAPLDQLSDVEGVDQQGMVGFETFRRFVTRVDYGTHTLTLIDPRHFDPRDAGVGLPFVFYGNGIAIQASLNGHGGSFTVDTGSRVSLTLNGPWAAKNGITGAGMKSVSGVTGWGVGGPSHAIAMRGSDFEMGSFKVDRPVAEISTDRGGAFSDASLAGNIGAGILKRYVVTLDYGHSTMYLKPIAGQPADLDTFDRAGMWYNRSADGYTVIDVMKGTPAEAAGLRPGDTILAVNGTPAKDIPLYQMRMQMRDSAAGTTVTFRVRNAAGTHDTEVTLRDLI
ncbi:MAG TPA: aspartyl protease family protein [Rhizomicrobium sp.]|nr:aspartyl protease family protein [Rhizomicrobium sp.]